MWGFRGWVGVWSRYALGLRLGLLDQRKGCSTGIGGQRSKVLRAVKSGEPSVRRIAYGVGLCSVPAATSR